MRVIAGQAKGRPLRAPKGLAVRPTTDKVKGAIFSMLEAVAFRRAEDVGERAATPFGRVLDLYAGSGALGIEALSRGATHVDFVETSAAARASIVENLLRTGLAPLATVHSISAGGAVSTFRSSYDLILLDPPYQDPSFPALLQSLDRSAIIVERTLVIVEHARTTTFSEISRDCGSRGRETTAQLRSLCSRWTRQADKWRTGVVSRAHRARPGRPPATLSRIIVGSGPVTLPGRRPATDARLE